MSIADFLQFQGVEEYLNSAKYFPFIIDLYLEMVDGSTHIIFKRRKYTYDVTEKSTWCQKVFAYIDSILTAYDYNVTKILLYFFK